MSVKVKAPGPTMKNVATAPIVFFDDAPLLGVFNGNIEVELTARVLAPSATGGVIAERVCVAHLRCSQQAAMTLMQSLAKAMEMARPGGPAVVDEERPALAS